MRRNGFLLPISSLPSKYGIGSFSKEAYEFVDILEKANQKISEARSKIAVDSLLHIP